MGLLDNTALTLEQWKAQLTPDMQDAADIIPMLQQTNEWTKEAHFMKGNLPMGHEHQIEVGLAEVYFRSINQGIPNSEDQTVDVTDTISQMETRSEVDAKLIERHPNPARFRLLRGRRRIEAMNQRQTRAFFYGNPNNDRKEYLGLTGRYSDLGAANAQNILNAGASGSDNTSLWLCVWGENSLFCPFPNHSPVGIWHKNLGEYAKNKSDGTTLQVVGDLWGWDMGCSLPDWRYVVRIANIDVSDLLGVTGTQATTASTNIIKLMLRAIDRIPSLGMGKAAWYCNRTVRSGLGIQALEKSSSALSIEGSAEQMRINAFGIPVRLVDQLVNTEELVA